jgi:hypothetical protein
MKYYTLIKEYAGMPKYAYVGMTVIQNEGEEGEPDSSYIPIDENIQNFEHIPASQVENSDNYTPLNTGI